MQPRPAARFSSFWIYPLASAVLIEGAVILEPGRLGSPLLFSIGSGGFLWTLIEYLMHRYFFHSQTANPALARLLVGLHRVHHAQPREPGFILARLRTSLPLSVLLLLLLYGVTESPILTAGVTVGVWMGFLYYEWVHYKVHTSAATFALTAKRSRHFSHHFVDEKKAFGVTSPLWDLVFGTYTNPRRSQP